MGDLYGWLIGVIGALVAFIAVRSRSGIGDKLKDAERRIDVINNAQGVKREVETMDDDRVIAEYKRLHDNRSR